MCSTHEVICLMCEKALAWWSMFHNIQREDEYVCSAAIREDDNKLIMDKVVQDDEHFDKLNEIVEREKLNTYEIDDKGRKCCTYRGWTYCNIKNNTYFCGSCARKLKYKCPVCGGTIWKERSA